MGFGTLMSVAFVPPRPKQGKKCDQPGLAFSAHVGSHFGNPFGGLKKQAKRCWASSFSTHAATLPRRHKLGRRSPTATTSAHRPVTHGPMAPWEFQLGRPLTSTAKQFAGPNACLQISHQGGRPRRRLGLDHQIWAMVSVIRRRTFYILYFLF